MPDPDPTGIGESGTVPHAEGLNSSTEFGGWYLTSSTTMFACGASSLQPSAAVHQAKAPEKNAANHRIATQEGAGLP